jgi:hypothetical protein
VNQKQNIGMIGIVRIGKYGKNLEIEIKKI